MQPETIIKNNLIFIYCNMSGFSSYIVDEDIKFSKSRKCSEVANRIVHFLWQYVVAGKAFNSEMFVHFASSVSCKMKK